MVKSIRDWAIRSQVLMKNHFKNRDFSMDAVQRLDVGGGSSRKINQKRKKNDSQCVFEGILEPHSYIDVSISGVLSITFTFLQGGLWLQTRIAGENNPLAVLCTT